MSFAQHLQKNLRFNFYATVRFKTKVSLKISLNLKSEFLDLKMIKINSKALLHLRFN